MNKQIEQKLEWAKEHKKEILIGSCIVGGAILLTALGAKGIADWHSKEKAHKERGEKILNAFKDVCIESTEVNEIAYHVDEDLFTNVCPTMEDVILNRDVEKLVIERAYDLGDNLSKHVTVNIENVYGD